MIEVIVVMGVMGLIIGALLLSMRQIIEGEILLKKMQAVEEESRFIMDLFAQDAQYSELDDYYKPGGNNDDYFLYAIRFILSEKKEDIGQENGDKSEYQSYYQNTPIGRQYYIARTLAGGAENLTTTLNNTALALQPLFRVRKIVSGDGAENYLVTISLTFQIESRNGLVLIPIQTSVISRTFEI